MSTVKLFPISGDGATMPQPEADFHTNNNCSASIIPPVVAVQAVFNPLPHQLVPYPPTSGEDKGAEEDGDDDDDDDDDDEKEDQEILRRIRSAVRHTTCASTTPSITSYFTVRPNTQQAAFHLLDQARARGQAHLIRYSAIAEGEHVFSVGVPPAPSGKYFPSGIDPQWWIGKSRAQIKAGPLATGAQVKMTERVMNQWEKKKTKKAKRLVEQQKRLEEALRWQESREGVDSESEGMEMEPAGSR